MCGVRFKKSIRTFQYFRFDILSSIFAVLDMQGAHPLASTPNLSVPMCHAVPKLQCPVPPKL